MGADRNVKLIAHRGLHNRDGNHENSRRAVLEAFESGVDGIEVDLQLLGDGSLVLFHDDVITEPGTDPRLLGSLTQSEFRDLLDYEPLFLEELLELDWQGKQVILECKPNRNHLSLVRKLQLRLQDLKGTKDLTLSSYDWDILEELTRRVGVDLAPVVTRLTGRNARGITSPHWSELHLSADLMESPEITEFAHHYEVIVWTVNDSERLEELETLGIKGIMTDNPDAF